MAEPGIYYNQKISRFQDSVSGRLVGRDQAVRSLRYDTESQIFVDSRGNQISRDLLATESRSAWRFSTTDLEGRVFLTGEARSVQISEADLANVRLNSNQNITGRIVVTTADGRVHVFEQSTGGGQKITAEEMKKKLTKQARGALLNTKDAAGNNYEIDTPTIGNDTVRVDYYVRTIKTR